MSNALPPKEQNLFKSVVRFYETKQLKKALKTADTVLKRFPEHGETLAMKGLTLNALDKKAEATDLVRRGLRLDLRSHICWHVYGLLHRSEREYRDAARAYLQALRYDKDNQQILRDLALLQIQIRDYDGLEETRRTLLTVKPNQRNNWIGFALSFHLLGNYASAISVLDTYQDTLKQSNEPEDRYEVSELLLYKNFILEESRDYAAALAHLDQVAHKLVDRLAARETRARLLSALGRYDDAARELRSLLRINPDNHIYHKGLHACALRSANKLSQPEPNGNPDLENVHELSNQLSTAATSNADYAMRKIANLEMRILGPTISIQSDEDAHVALGVCNQLTHEFPRSRTASRLALNILPSGHHPQFVPRVDAYVRRFLRKGIPSLFSDVKSLYADTSKAEQLGRLFEGYRECLEDEGRGSLPEPSCIPDVDAELHEILGKDAATKVDPEPPCTLLWVLHYLAQHYDRIGKRELALETIEAALAHTPTAIECYLVRARILKHCGDLKGAVEVSDEARNLDLADRYLNTKCSKYALRADMVSQAENWVGLFTRDADSGGTQALYDMQCMWFELEAAESHLRCGQLAQALKMFTAVDRHFADMVEDQFDFHSYCLRKVTLRAYVHLLRFEDRIRGHPYYARAAWGLVECYLRLRDMSERERILITGEHSDIDGFANMTDSERRKAVSKRKKQMHRKKQAQHGLGSGKGSVKQAKGSGKLAADGGDKKNAGSTENPGKSTGGGTSNENKPKSNQGWMERDSSGVERLKELFKEEKGKDLILSEATKLMKELQLHLSGHMQTQVLAFDLAVRKGKHLQALRAVKRARRIDTDHPDALLLCVKLAHMLSQDSWSSSFSNTTKIVYEREGQVLEGKTMSEFIEDYLARNRTSAQKRVGVGKCRLWMAKVGMKGASSIEEACEYVAQVVDESECEGVGVNSLSAAFCRDLLYQLKRDGLEPKLLSRIADSCRLKYPRTSCF